MYQLCTQRRNWLLPLLFLAFGANAFSVLVVNPSFTTTSRERTSRLCMASGEGFGVLASTEEENVASVGEEKGVVASLALLDIKQRLLDLLSRMTGTDEEFRLVETYVNALEGAHVPPVTLDFFNLAMTGDWQLLFSTNLSGGGPRPNFRLRELLQCIRSNRLGGDLTNVATWEFAEDDGTFDMSGSFSVKCTYQIHQGSRMECKLEDLCLEPHKGSRIPSDVPSLVGMLHRSMPKEMFDPNQHAMDTTYLDGNLKIVRLTGQHFEGVRNIFIRKGGLQLLDPTSGQLHTFCAQPET